MFIHKINIDRAVSQCIIHSFYNQILLMSESQIVKYYSPLEEKINIVSHALGLFLGVIGLVFLVIKANNKGDWYTVSFIIYGVSIILLYAASTFYHSSKKSEQRLKLKIFDHAAIYILIAGTYTPYLLVTLHGTLGWKLFFIVWSLALIGIILKFFFIGRFTLISTLAYVLMGWLIVFAIDPMIANLSADGFFWFITGGVFYTLGAIIYVIKYIKLNHAIFHMFVLCGSVSHYISIYCYV